MRETVRFRGNPEIRHSSDILVLTGLLRRFTPRSDKVKFSYLFIVVTVNENIQTSVVIARTNGVRTWQSSAHRAECEGLGNEKTKSLKSTTRRHVYCEVGKIGKHSLDCRVVSLLAVTIIAKNTLRRKLKGTKSPRSDKKCITLFRRRHCERSISGVWQSRLHTFIQ